MIRSVKLFNLSCDECARTFAGQPNEGAIALRRRAWAAGWERLYVNITLLNDEQESVKRDKCELCMLLAKDPHAKD